MNQNDIEKAIDILENMQDVECENCPNEESCEKAGTGLCVNAIGVVRRVLEKQIPKEAVKKQIFEGERAEKLQSKGIINYETFKCPECNHIVSNRGFTGITVKKFCDNCGQALKEDCNG